MRAELEGVWGGEISTTDLFDPRTPQNELVRTPPGEGHCGKGKDFYPEETNASLEYECLRDDISAPIINADDIFRASQKKNGRQ